MSRIPHGLDQHFDPFAEATCKVLLVLIRQVSVVEADRAKEGWPQHEECIEE